MNIFAVSIFHSATQPDNPKEKLFFFFSEERSNQTHRFATFSTEQEESVAIFRSTTA